MTMVLRCVAVRVPYFRGFFKAIINRSYARPRPELAPAAGKVGCFANLPPAPSDYVPV